MKKNCVLKRLAPARQRALYEYMEGLDDEPGHTIAECLAWLKSSGVPAKRPQLSQWRTWYLQRLRFQWCREITSLMVEDIRMAHRLFNLLILKTADDKAWQRHRNPATRKRAMSAIERKLERALEKYDQQQGRS